MQAPRASLGSRKASTTAFWVTMDPSSTDLLMRTRSCSPLPRRRSSDAQLGVAHRVRRQPNCKTRRLNDGKICRGLQPSMTGVSACMIALPYSSSRWPQPSITTKAARFTMDGERDKESEVCIRERGWPTGRRIALHLRLGRISLQGQHMWTFGIEQWMKCSVKPFLPLFLVAAVFILRDSQGLRPGAVARTPRASHSGALSPRATPHEIIRCPSAPAPWLRPGELPALVTAPQAGRGPPRGRQRSGGGPGP